MAITRLSLSDIETELLRIVGNYPTSPDSDWKTTAALYRIINTYGQKLVMKAAQFVKSAPPGRQVRIDMYRTTTNSTTTGSGLLVSSGGSVIYLPVNCDLPLTLYDRTAGAQVPFVRNVRAYHQDLLDMLPGTPAACELLDYVTVPVESTWARQGVLYPATASGVTPSLTLEFYRLPASMATDMADATYPDCDPKYDWLFVYGPACDLLRPENPTYERYKAMETEMLKELAVTAKIV